MSGKRPTDHLEPAAKKRGSDRQLTKDDASEEEEEQPVDPGNFARASEDVIKQRKIIKARRGAGGAEGGAPKANPFAGIQLAASAPAAPAANPFAGVQLFGVGAAAPTPAPTPTKPEAPAAQPQEAAAAAASEQPAEEAQQPTAAAAEQQQEQQPAAAAEAQQDKAAADKTADQPAAAAASFGSLAGASGGLAFGGSGFGNASGGFGSLAGSSGGAPFSFGAASAAATTTSIFSFSAGSSAAAGGAAAAAPAATTGTSLFGATPASGTPLVFGGGQAKAPAKVELQGEQSVQTGEEDERTVFSGEGALFEFDSVRQWRERGRGEMRLNVAPSGQARLVMRQKGNLRLLMNANLWGEMQVSKMEGGKGVTFACVNAAVPEGEGTGAAEDKAAAAPAAAPKLATFALRIKAPEVLDEFVAAVNAHKAGGSGGKKEA